MKLILLSDNLLQMLKTNVFRLFPCVQYFEDIPNYVNYLIKYAQTVLEMLVRIRFSRIA